MNNELGQDSVESNGDLRYIMLDGQFYLDKLIPVKDMIQREQLLYLQHDSCVMQPSTAIKRRWHVGLRENAHKRRSKWL